MASLGAQLGAGSKLPMASEPEEDEPEYEAEEDMDSGEGDGGDVPPEFMSAYEEWEADPSASSMYAMIEACKAGESKPSGILALMGGKPKK